MKESTGAVSAIYVVIFFVIIMFGFIISTLSYYKSYKINNSLTAAIEDYGGFFKSKNEDGTERDSSYKEIEKRLTSYGYTRSDIICKTKNPTDEKFVKADGSIINEDGKTEATSSELGYKGYCVYIVDDTPNKGENGAIPFEYYSYKVTTGMTLDFGLFNFNLPIKMSSRTSTMYSCYGSNC